MESTFTQACLGLMTLALWIGLAVVIAGYLEFRRALQAVEIAAYRLMETAEKLHNASAKVQDFADNVRSGWMRAFETAVAAAQTFWPKREKTEAGSSSEENNH